MSLTINQIVDMSHSTAKEKGWWDKPRTGLEVMALIHSEVSEAVEDLRNGNTQLSFEDSLRKPVGLPSELADIIIRIADYCGHEGIDLDYAITTKLVYNKTRPYRHGGKAA